MKKRTTSKEGVSDALVGGFYASRDHRGDVDVRRRDVPDASGGWF